MKICIDPGHGGDAKGATKNGLIESHLNLEVAEMVTNELEKDNYPYKGHTVLMTREDDATLSLSDRTRLANDFMADLFVSIHFNSFPTPAPQGFEVLYYPKSRNGMQLAGLILTSMQEAMPDHIYRGLKPRDNLFVLEHTQMPACLVECEFISNIEQAEWISEPGSIEQIAKAITRGINIYCKLKEAA